MKARRRADVDTFQNPNQALYFVSELIPYSDQTFSFRSDKSQKKKRGQIQEGRETMSASGIEYYKEEKKKAHYLVEVRTW